MYLLTSGNLYLVLQRMRDWFQVVIDVGEAG